jgi:hypothetical protein
MSAAPSCPDVHVLRRFLLGQLPTEEVERLAGHVEQCAHCVTILQHLQERDALLDALQTPPADPLQLPAGLLERVVALPRPMSASRTVVSGGLLAHLTETPADVTQELYDFLAPPQQPGELGRLGAYRVLRVLGAGGMGVVFEAEDTELKRRVALKALRPGLAVSASARQRFLREGRAAAGLRHEHIVPIYQVGEDRGVPFLTMPLLQGETLEERLQRESPLSPGVVLRIGQEIAAALAAAHEQGLIHRDVKPSNVWLEAQEAPNVKLLDFGLARAVGGDAHLTQSGVIVGTPAYMAPEQARGEAVDARADLFSLGAVLYRACTGRLPFPGANALATLLALAQGSPPPPDKVNPRLPPGLSELVMKLLARRPEGRYASAQEVTAALDAVAAGRATSRRPLRRIGAVVAALVLVGAVVLAGYYLTLPWQSDGSALAGVTDLFAPAVAYSAGLYPTAVAVADFNGDGKADLVINNVQSHTVSVLLGQGDGTFAAPLVSAAGEWFAWTLAVADFNRDGKPDLVVANNGSHQISILLGKGDGMFQPPVQYGVGTNPGRVAVADFDGDGKPDLAVGNNGGNVSILLGHGDGTFRDAVNYAIGASCSGLVIADFDRDGRPDLAVADGRGRIALLRGHGDGTFQDAVFHDAGTNSLALAVDDFNNDGKPDLVVTGTRGFRVLLGQGDGSFQPAIPYDAGMGFWAVVVADFDGDGKADLALSCTDQVATVGRTVHVLPGHGDGTFGAARKVAVGRGPRGLALGDFNGDGALDLAVVNHNSNDVSVLLHRPVPASPAHLAVTADYTVGGEPSAVVSADLDRDGQADLVIADQAGAAVQVLRSQGDGTFADAGRFAAGQAPAALALGDFNRDGRLDLAVADARGDAVQVLPGSSAGAFGAARAYAVGKNPVAVAVGDFNGDGQLDLVTANYEDRSLSVLLGQSNGAFQPAVTVPGGARPRAVAVADVNGDGKADLLVAGYLQVGTVTVLLGQGNGSFAAPVSYPVGPYPIALSVADYNGDGKPDLAVANWGGSDVNVLLGRGDGTFRPAVNYSAANSCPTALQAVDIDGDGRLDLLVALARNTVGVLRGNGDGTFQPLVEFHGTGLYPVGLAVGHWHGRVRPDVVTANARSGNITLLRNQSAVPHLAVWAWLGSARIDANGMACHIFVRPHDPAAFGSNSDLSFTGPLRFRSSDPRAVLPDDCTFRPTDEGIQGFPVTFRTPGVQTVTVTDTRRERLAGRVCVLVVRPADLKLVLEAPKSVVAGRPFGVSVNVMSRFREWTQGYGGTVHFRCTDAAATLPGAYMFNRAESVHTFTGACTLRTPGTWTLTVTDTGIPELTGSATITVGAAP